ncbi:hypothetical protein [Aquibacillus saliphilus]
MFYNLRVNFHPNQFRSLTSPRRHVTDNAMIDMI